MKAWINAAVAVAMSLAAGYALAQQEGMQKKEPSAKQAAQQQKMRDCNATAKERELKGDERKAFMRQCLSKEGAPQTAHSQTAQQQRMQECNATAKERELKGDERKEFVRQCLSKQGEQKTSKTKDKKGKTPSSGKG